MHALYLLKFQIPRRGVGSVGGQDTFSGGEGGRNEASLPLLIETNVPCTLTSLCAPLCCRWFNKLGTDDTPMVRRAAAGKLGVSPL